MSSKFYKYFFIWFVLNILVVITMDLALFMQTTPAMKDSSTLTKLLVTEFWATVQWVFAIPANRIGNKFLTVPQLGLSSYIFDFVGQIGSNMLWLNVPTTIDDYAAMVIIMIAMYISVYKVLG